MRKIKDLTLIEIFMVGEMLAKAQTLFQLLVMFIAKKFDLSPTELYENALESMDESTDLITKRMETSNIKLLSVIQLFDGLKNDLK